MAGRIPRILSPWCRAIAPAAGRDRRSRHIAADGDAAAIGLDLLLRRTGLSLGRGIKMHVDSPKSTGGSRKSAADPSERRAVALVAQKSQYAGRHDTMLVGCGGGILTVAAIPVQGRRCQARHARRELAQRQSPRLLDVRLATLAHAWHKAAADPSEEILVFLVFQKRPDLIQRGLAPVQREEPRLIELRGRTSAKGRNLLSAARRRMAAPGATLPCSGR